MAYFITHPSACRLFAKCHGWQETLANFFVRTRRSSVAQIPSHRSSSHDVLAPYRKDQSLTSSQETNTNDNSLQEASISTFDIIVETDDSTQTYASSKQSLAPKSISVSMEQLTNSKDSATDNRRYSNDTIITPPQSTSASREDLLSLLKTEHSYDNINGRVRNNSDSSPSMIRSTTDISMILLIEDKKSHGKRRRLGPALRQFLGWLIALVKSG
jgi:PleD family two-component response regulator